MSDNNDLFRLALTAHRRAGYDAGYARAIADVLAAGVFVAEGVLRETAATAAPPGAAPAEPRALLYRFVAALDAEIRDRAGDSGEVSDGLGI